MNIRATCIASVVLALAAASAWAANSPPLSGSWNIAPSGKASSSGELLFRVTPGNGTDPVEVTVSVASGTSELGVASDIRRAFGTQLRADQFNVEPGEGANVLVTGQNGGTNFSLELIDSDVESVRVVVQSAEPVAPPTVPKQGTPANSPAVPATPPAPGAGLPPENSTPPANASQPAAPPQQNSPPLPNPTPSPNSSDTAGAPASAPPPR